MLLKCTVSSIKCGFLICRTCHLQSGFPFFVYFDFIYLHVSSMSNFHPYTMGQRCHLFRLTYSFVCRETGTPQKIPLTCVGSVHSGWTTLGLPQPKVACASWVYTAQAPGCSARALSQVGPGFHALPKSAQVLRCFRRSQTWIGIAFCALPRFKQLR